MNRVFSIVWNVSKQVWAVVSEMASGGRKSTTNSVSPLKCESSRSVPVRVDQQHLAVIAACGARSLLGATGVTGSALAIALIGLEPVRAQTVGPG